jgi:ribosomal protein S11
LSPDLLTALREQTPAAPSDLRDRVAQIAATPPPPRRTFTLRRALLWSAPATAVAALAVAVVVGVFTSSTPRSESAAPPAGNLERKSPQTERLRGARDKATPAPVQELRRAVPAPSGRRAQDVQTSLRLLVDDPGDLSSATQRALRTTRRLGGYVVTVDYGTPEPTEGTANLRVRIPVSRVQAAVVQFSGLGRILAQQTQIADLQQRLDEITRQIRRTKDKTRVAALRRERTELNRRATYATVDLALTTHEPRGTAAPPSRFDRAVDDAVGVLTAELALGAYVLIVAAPLLLLLAAAFAGSRAYRRYLDQRLLERA